MSFFLQTSDSIVCGPAYLRMVAKQRIKYWYWQSTLYKARLNERIIRAGHSEAGGVRPLPMNGTAYYSSACTQAGRGAVGGKE